MGNDSKRLVKSSNRMLSGVCGGLGEYLNIDPTVVRILFVIFGMCGGGVIAYIVAAIIMPEV